MEEYMKEQRRVQFKMKKTIYSRPCSNVGKKNFTFAKSLGIIQILILIIGILAFSYIFGEIEKKSGIEISRGVGIVSAQEIVGNNCDEPNAKQCSTDGN